MNEVVIESDIQSDKNAWIYAILLCFFGALGIHRFYINKTGTGILYLLTGGVFGVGLFIDFVMIIVSQVRDSSGAVLHGARSLKTLAIIAFVANIVVIIFVFNSIVPAVFY